MSGAVYPDLAGQTVIVTGGGSGIGADIVRGFARQRCRVGFLDIAREASKALVAELKATGHDDVLYAPCDLTRIDDMRAAIDGLRAAFGPVGILVNNAAHDDRHAFETVTEDYFDGRIAANLKHIYFAAQTVIGDMTARGKGAIVNMGSISWILGSEDLSVYSMCKAGIHGLTRSLAREYGRHNIRVNTIAPGWIITERQRRLWWTPTSEEELMDHQCLKRLILPVDVAKVAVFLASDEASACTSQQFIVDGGWV